MKDSWPLKYFVPLSCFFAVEDLIKLLLPCLKMGKLKREIKLRPYEGYKSQKEITRLPNVSPSI